MTNVTFDSVGDVLYTYISGEIDHDSAQTLRENIDGTIAGRLPKHLIMDFSAVSFMDSSGLGLILGRKRRMEAYSGDLTIQNPPAQMQKVLKIAKIKIKEMEHL